MIETGTLLQGRFLIEGRIGEGGMGAVYLAVDQKFGSRVAIKETFYGDPELAEAFEREARLLNGLHHPIFPHVSDHFSENGGHFLVMEYIEGEDMSVILKRGEVFPVEDVMRWTLDLLDGLDYLHSQVPPIIHRDIKPNNLKLTSRGNIVLLDFGMAKETSGNTLGMRSVFGYSRRYSPLEQIEGTGTDHRSDIFSLGATVFHLLTGKPPVDVLARASAIVSGRPDPLERADAFRPDVPDSVASIINSALALNADHRFASARAMWSALEFALGIDLVNEDALPAAETPQPAVVVTHGAEFPALEAYKAGTEDEAQTPTEYQAAVAAALHPSPEQDVVDVETANFADVDLGAAEQVTPMQDAGSSPDRQNDGSPLDRAVIHLGSVDAVDVESETPPPTGDEKDTSGRMEIPVAASAARPAAHPNFLGKRLSSTSVLWLTLLFALLSGLVVFAVFGTSSDEPAVQESPGAVAPADTEPYAEPETAAAANGQPEEEAATEEPGTDAATEDIASAEAAPVDEEEVPAADETQQTETEVEPIAADRRGTSRQDRDQRQNREERQDRDGREARVDDEPEPRRAEARREAPAPARRVPQPQARRRSGAERPRLVDVFEGPPTASIETVLTGVPYERRRRWRGGWDDDDYEFRRRMHRARRENLRPFPF